MQMSPTLSNSPSFNSCSNSDIAQIAARVVEELRAEGLYEEELYVEREEESESRKPQEDQEEDDEKNSKPVDKEGEKENPHEDEDENEKYSKPVDKEEEKENPHEDEDEDEDEEFEFAVVARDFELSSQISADDIFYNGQIRPVYPLFNRDLLLNGNEAGGPNSNPNTSTMRLPLRKLFIEERKTALSSSVASNELEGVPEETYCVWRPKTQAEAEAAEPRWKKSSSGGVRASKRWKFKDLINRSRSDGSKENFVFVTSTSNGGRMRVKESAVAVSGKEAVALHGEHGGDHRHRRSDRPYRQDLVGFFGNVNGLSRNLQHNY